MKDLVPPPEGLFVRSSSVRRLHGAACFSMVAAASVVIVAIATQAVAAQAPEASSNVELGPDVFCWQGDSREPCTDEQLGTLDGAGCASGAGADGLSCYRPILLLSTGYAAGERDLFFRDAEVSVEAMNGCEPADAQCKQTRGYSAREAEKLLYIASFHASEPVGDSFCRSDDPACASFGAWVAPLPIRGASTLTLERDAVQRHVDRLTAEHSALSRLVPWTVVVVYNVSGDQVANAIPPLLSDGSWGTVLIGREWVGAAGVLAHEIAHSALNFVDEYYEDAFANTSVGVLDPLTALFHFDGSASSAVDSLTNLLDVYDVRFSNILAHNGSDNVATTSAPATVTPPELEVEEYLYEGGAFFGEGVWRQHPATFMRSHWDDPFTEAPSHLRVMESALVSFAPGRANDRISAVGPNDNYPFELGSETVVMVLDADKNHAFQPTTEYEVRVTWNSTRFHLCPGRLAICTETVPHTWTRGFAPEADILSVEDSAMGDLANLVNGVACSLAPGATAFGVDLCAEGADALDLIAASFPGHTLRFRTPYQRMTVPTTRFLTTYSWQVRTHNGRYSSGWTSPSQFFRSL